MQELSIERVDGFNEFDINQVKPITYKTNVPVTVSNRLYHKYSNRYTNENCNTIGCIFKRPEDCVDEWARVQEMRKTKGLVKGGNHHTPPLYVPPTHVVNRMAGRRGPNKRGSDGRAGHVLGADKHWCSN